MKNEPFSLLSFLKDAFAGGLLSIADITRLQEESLLHLAALIESFTRGESSSVRKETAQEILRSQYYTVGIFLKDAENDQEIAARLREESFESLFQKGRKQLEKEIRVARIFTERARGNMIKVSNCFYRETLTQGILLFFKKYDPDYFAHEIPGSIDYPIANQVFSLSGIEFIQAYSERLFLENCFCGCFQPDRIKRLLAAFDPEYQELFFNIFERVLLNALGCSILKKDPRELLLSDSDRTHLCDALSGYEATSFRTVLSSACSELCISLGISGEGLSAYMQQAVHGFPPNAFQSIR